MPDSAPRFDHTTTQPVRLYHEACAYWLDDGTLFAQFDGEGPVEVTSLGGDDYWSATYVLLQLNCAWFTALRAEDFGYERPGRAEVTV